MHQDIVQVLSLCHHAIIIIKILMNAFVHLYLAFYVVFISLNTLYSSITFILIYILEARYTHMYWRSLYCTNNIVLYFFNHLFSILFHDRYLFLLPTYLLFYWYTIMALIVFYVLYFLFFYFMYA